MDTSLKDYKSPIVSVITIVRNNERLIARAIESVLSQTFIHYKYIIIDDGSDDSTSEIIKGYSNDDKRINAVFLQNNIGRASARNLGLSKADTKYIFFLDSDDQLTVTSLSQVIDVAEKYDSDIVYGRYKCLCNKTGKLIHNHYTNKLVKTEQHNIKLSDNKNLIYNHHIIGRLYRKDLIDKNNISFSSKRKNAEDVTFSFYTSYYASNISVAPNILTYEYSLGNYLDKANADKVYDARANILETINFAKKHSRNNIADAMIIKGLKFACDFKRAEKVFGDDKQSFKDYLISLKPFLSLADSKLIESLKDSEKYIFYHLNAGNYEAAIQTWKFYNCDRTNKSTANIYDINDMIELNMKLSRRLEKIYSSNFWKFKNSLNISSKYPIKGNSDNVSNANKHKLESNSLLTSSEVNIELLIDANYKLSNKLDKIYSNNLWKLNQIFKKSKKTFKPKNTKALFKLDHKYDVNSCNFKHIDVSNELDTGGYGKHRSGWNFVMNSLQPLHNKDGIYIVGFLEKVFCWNKPKQIEFPKPWIGFTHRPHQIPDWFPKNMKNQFYENEYFQNTLHNNVGIITLTQYHANYLSNILPTNINSLFHPTEFTNRQWDSDLFLKNRLNVVQIGWWLRKLHAIFMLPDGDYTKIFLSKLNVENAAADFFKIEKERLSKLNQFSDSMYDSTKIIEFLPDGEYDDLLSSCIIFLDLYDASANNAIVEGIARATPILVNKLEPVKEYLGDDYPFYYSTYEEARDKLHDRDLIIKTHEYLKSDVLRDKISIDRFKTDLINTLSTHVSA